MRSVYEDDSAAAWQAGLRVPRLPPQVPQALSRAGAGHLPALLRAQHGAVSISLHLAYFKFVIFFF